MISRSLDLQKLSKKVSRGGRAAPPHRRPPADSRPLGRPRSHQDPLRLPQDPRRPMQERPKTLQDRLKSAQEAPQMPSRRSKIALRRQKSGQERPKSGQEGSWNDPGAILRRFGAILGCKMCVFPYVFQYFLRFRGFALRSRPKASWSPSCAHLGRLKRSRERPRSGQERPERPKSGPRAAQERPKSDPRAAQE